MPSKRTQRALLGKTIVRTANTLATIAERATSLGLTPPALLGELEPELRHWAARLRSGTAPDTLAGAPVVAIVTVVEADLAEASGDAPTVSPEVLAAAVTRGRPSAGTFLLTPSTPDGTAQPVSWRVCHTRLRTLPPQRTPRRSSPSSGSYPVIADAAFLHDIAQRLTADQPALALKETDQ